MNATQTRARDRRRVRQLHELTIGEHLDMIDYHVQCLTEPDAQKGYNRRMANEHTRHVRDMLTAGMLGLKPS